MPPQVISSILEKRIQLTHDVFELVFKLIKPEELTFRAGQFVNIRVDDGNPRIFFRSYSIMSPPDEKNIIRTCIKLVPAGRATPWLTITPEGTPINMMGPLGMLKYNEMSEKDTIFVATGTGITPLRCMIEDQLAKGNTKKIHLIWGFRYEKDIFYKNEFDALTKRYSNFNFTMTISRPEASWTGEKGRVTDWLKEHLVSPSTTQMYICGIGEMVADVAALCEKRGMLKEDVHVEKYD